MGGLVQTPYFTVGPQKLRVSDWFTGTRCSGRSHTRTEGFLGVNPSCCLWRTLVVDKVPLSSPQAVMGSGWTPEGLWASGPHPCLCSASPSVKWRFCSTPHRMKWITWGNLSVASVHVCNLKDTAIDTDSKVSSQHGSARWAKAFLSTSCSSLKDQNRRNLLCETSLWGAVESEAWSHFLAHGRLRVENSLPTVHAPAVSMGECAGGCV